MKSLNFAVVFAVAAAACFLDVGAQCGPGSVPGSCELHFNLEIFDWTVFVQFRQMFLSYFVSMQHLGQTTGIRQLI